MIPLPCGERAGPKPKAWEGKGTPLLDRFLSYLRVPCPHPPTVALRGEGI